MTLKEDDARDEAIGMVQLLDGLPDQVDKATLNTAARHIAVDRAEAAVAFEPDYLQLKRLAEAVGVPDAQRS